MKKHTPFLLIPCLLLAGCASQVAVSQQSRHDQSVALYEIRSELADLRHALSNTQVEVQLLEDSIQQQELYSKDKADSKKSSQLANLERRLELIETEQNRISSHAVQTSSYLGDYKSKITEIETTLEKQRKLLTEALQLKNSLTSLTNSLQEKEGTPPIYKVKSGDSLEKIARNYKTSVGAIKAKNNLSHNTIIVGQELKIPVENSR
jgi:LysM repeat protein